MPYITSIELDGMEKGQLLNCRENLLDLLEVRFGAVDEALRQRVNAETNLTTLKGWLRLAATVTNLEEFKLPKSKTSPSEKD